jgi:uncharacterized phage-like protein YoqJ
VIVAGTGHRPDKLGGYGLINPVRQAIIRELYELLKAWQPVHVISGMALGFDQWLAEVAIELKIPLVAAIPFKDFDALWPAASRKHYENLMAQADGTMIVCSGGYSAMKMQMRNEWMMNRATHIVSAFDGSQGGTANTLAVARALRRPIALLSIKRGLVGGWTYENGAPPL